MTDTSLIEQAEALAGEIKHKAKPSVMDEGLTNEVRLNLLAELAPIEYDKARDKVAKLLGVRSSTLDKEVARLRRGNDRTDGVAFADVEPWPAPVELGTVLTEIASTVQRFIVCNDETAHATALWIAMTWVIDSVQVCPLAVITAPEKRCGKSQLLFLLGKMVARPLAASNISPAALFRAIDAWSPTLLVDEADAFMRDNEELRGILNSGHTRDSAYIVRTVGDEHTPKLFNVWGAKAIAGIGHLADTLMDRSVILELRRKLPHEQVSRLRHAEAGLFDDIASKLARFADDSKEAVRQSRPELPSVLNDRAQDNWEPLLAIAEVAGGAWPALAKQAALKLSGTNDGGSVGNELLADIQEIIQGKRLTRISTADLIHELCADEEKPWATYNRGRQIAPRQVASKLKSYGILSATIKFGSIAAKGYRAEQFDEAFARYLSSPPDLSVYPLQPNTEAGCMATDKNTVTVTSDLSVTSDQQAAADGHAQKVTDNPLRYGCENLSVTMKPAPSKESYGVTDRNGETAKCENGELEL